METIILLSPWLLFSPTALSPSFSPSLSLSYFYHLTDNPYAAFSISRSLLCHFRLCFSSICMTVCLCRSFSTSTADFGVSRSIVEDKRNVFVA